MIGRTKSKVQNTNLTFLTTRGDLIETFKTLKRINHVKTEEWFCEVSDDVRATRSTTIVDEGGEKKRELVLKVERAKKDIRQNFFNVRAAKEWNLLPDKVKGQKSVLGFKAAYDSWKKGDKQPETATRAMTENSLVNHQQETNLE